MLAERIAKKISELEKTEVLFTGLDITPYRDDISGKADLKNSLKLDVEGKNVILIDDVIYTGRSTRAAIDAVIECGRPKCIQLAVLVDRGHRELPIRPDYVGKNVPTSREETVKVMVRETDGTDKVVIMIPEDEHSGNNID